MALGFAGGALSGYNAVLQTKMKEDYENRMEEARLERQKNYARWTEDTINAPIRTEQYARQDARYKVEDQFKERELGQRDQQIDISRAQLDISRRSAANQEARLNNEERRLQMQEERDKITNQINQLKLDEITNPALKIEREAKANQALVNQVDREMIMQEKSPQEREFKRALVQASRATSFEELSKYENRTDPELSKDLRAAVFKAQEEARKSINELKTEDIIKLAAERGASKETLGKGGASYASQFLVDQAGASVINSYGNLFGKGRNTPEPPQSDSKPTGVTKDQWIDNLAEGVRRGNTAAIETYNKLDLSTQRAVDSKKKYFQTLEEEKEKSYGKQTGFSTLSGAQSRQYISPTGSGNQIYIPMPGK